MQFLSLFKDIMFKSLSLHTVVLSHYNASRYQVAHEVTWSMAASQRSQWLIAVSDQKCKNIAVYARFTCIRIYTHPWGSISLCNIACMYCSHILNTTLLQGSPVAAFIFEIFLRFFSAELFMTFALFRWQVSSINSVFFAFFFQIFFRSLMFFSRSPGEGWLSSKIEQTWRTCVFLLNSCPSSILIKSLFLIPFLSSVLVLNLMQTYCAAIQLCSHFHIYFS